MKLTKNTSKKGFTLIELLVVIAIIGVLSSVVLVSLDQARARARDAKRISELRQVATALEMYYSDHGSYPIHNDENGGCNANARPSWNSSLAVLVPTYLPGVPADPIDTGKYCYAYLNGEHFGNRGSSYHCGGESRSNYEWSILLTMEGNHSSDSIVPVTRNGVGEYTHCILGGAK